jgi:hypothetical protein
MFPASQKHCFPEIDDPVVRQILNSTPLPLKFTFTPISGTKILVFQDDDWWIDQPEMLAWFGFYNVVNLQLFKFE